MRLSIASFLRRLANRLDPVVPAPMTTWTHYSTNGSCSTVTWKVTT